MSEKKKKNSLWGSVPLVALQVGYVYLNISIFLISDLFHIVSRRETLASGTRRVVDMRALEWVSRCRTFIKRPRQFICRC